MKTLRKLTLTSILIVGGSSLFSQTWGGDNVGLFPQQQTLGTNNNRPFRFETNGVQKMTINGIL